MKFSELFDSMCGIWIPCSKALPPKKNGVPFLAEIGDSGVRFPIVLQWCEEQKRWECDLGDSSFEMDEKAIEAWMPIVYPEDFDSLTKA